ncbi:MAG: hypothetical protein PVI09_12900 [Anaerolineae bacterium]|jgi:hypothetical protein
METMERGGKAKRPGPSLRTVGGLLVLAFVIALGITIGKEMSAEAMAVVVGIVCGVAASIPASLLMLVAITRRDRSQTKEWQKHAAPPGYPPVMVIQGTPSHSLGSGPQAGYWPAPPAGPPSQRTFHVVGGDDRLLDNEWQW